MHSRKNRDISNRREVNLNVPFLRLRYAGDVLMFNNFVQILLMIYVFHFLSVFPFHTTWKFNFSQLNVRLSCFFFIAAFAMLLFILHVFLFSIDVHGIIFQFFCFLYFFREQNIFFVLHSSRMLHIIFQLYIFHYTMLFLLFFSILFIY